MIIMGVDLGQVRTGISVCDPREVLASPVKGDVPVTSGESGAVGMGLISTLMQDEAYKELKEALDLDQNSRVLMFSTEGDTDPEKYRRIVWGGEYATV